MENFVFVLIDDNAHDITLFPYTLSRVDRDIQFKSFTCPKDAIYHLREKTVLPDCIYIDMNMPGMNGIHCLRELEKIDHLLPVPKYIYSGMPDEAMSQYVNAGMQFVPKCTAFEDAVTSLRSVIGRHRICSV